MTLPNFLIIGAAKAGTTSLYSWLAQHPQIYTSPIKEPNFFALQGEELNYPAGTIHQRYLIECKLNLDAYLDLFKRVSDETAIGEASPIYLYHSQAASRIREFIPHAKIIAILRDPVERAYSNFLHHVRDGFETFSDFSQALQAEKERMKNGWWWGFYYISGGFYSQQLKRYLKHFDRRQIKIYLYEDLRSNAQSLLQDIFEFLQIDSTFVPNRSQKSNGTGIPKNRILHRFLLQQNPLKNYLKPALPPGFRERLRLYLSKRNLSKPPLPPALKTQLKAIYREDILELQNLIQRDLSHWLD
ncbi:MAG: sulfotransferase [Cyanobacteriota bacterium]|nr:sulfotransferase [Cyanobacteriota bacterium]